MGENYSLSDVAAVTGGNGFAGGNSWILIILFALIFGGGGLWGNNATAGRCATVEDVNNSANFTRLETQVRDNANLTERKADAIISGICDSSYATLQNFSNLRYENSVGQKDILGQIALSTAANKEAIHAEGEATRALIQQNKIETLQQRINQLELQNAMGGVVRYPTNMTYTAGTSPFCNCNCGNGNI